MKQKIRQKEKKLDFKMIAQLKKLKINFKSLNFVVNIGTEDAAVTALTTGALATSIGIALRSILNLNKDNYFKVIPIYQNKNLLKIDFNCMFEIKLINIIYTILALKKVSK